MSAITTASLREALWEGADLGAEESVDVEDSGSTEPAAASVGDPDPSVHEAAAAGGGEPDAERRQAAIDEAVARLARVGRLDTASKAALVQTLQETAPEDWPVVVEAFAESLESSASLAAEAAAIGDEVSAAAEIQAMGQAKVEEAGPGSGGLAPVPAAGAVLDATVAVSSSAPSLPTPPAELPVAPPVAAIAPEPDAELGEEFAVRHACFARRVQGWGVVERFPENRFAAGQDVIVYVELANLSASESPDGCTTCVDAALRLVDERGRQVHEWSFEPIVETVPTRRHDYFARYVIRIPDAAPVGAGRLVLQVYDTLTGRVASAELPLEVVSRQVAAR